MGGKTQLMDKKYRKRVHDIAKHEDLMMPSAHKNVMERLAHERIVTDSDDDNEY